MTYYISSPTSILFLDQLQYSWLEVQNWRACSRWLRQFSPSVCTVRTIYMINASITRVLFKVKMLHTEGFCADYRTYIV